ncbi:MAG: hypothetical protein Q9219_000295 [cf. Caloplaca sp. 3 TL-2023]
MSAQTLITRLQPLRDAHQKTLQLIHRLSKLSASLDSEADDDRVELSSEIHQHLKEQEEDFEILRQEFEDQTNTASWASAVRRRDSDRGRVQTDLAAEVTRLGEDQKFARSQFRKAQLQAKRNAEAAKRKERELLFAGLQEGGTGPRQGRRKGHEELSKEELEANASADVTVALRRVHALMQTEVSKSQFALETLHQSTAALSSLSESYTSLDAVLSSSRNLVSTLLHSQKSDTWYLESAFWILVLTIAWLVFRRILYGPGWWLFYLPITAAWRITGFIIHFIFGATAALAGAVGARSQSTAIAQVSSQVQSSLLQQPTATGQIPTFQPGMAAPSIQVGAGGKGQPPPQQPQQSEKSLSETVGALAEKATEGTVANDSQSEETTLRERAADEPPNPKKRMWEEDASTQEASRERDEL